MLKSQRQPNFPAIPYMIVCKWHDMLLKKLNSYCRFMINFYSQNYFAMVTKKCNRAFCKYSEPFCYLEILHFKTSVLLVTAVRVAPYPMGLFSL